MKILYLSQRFPYPPNRGDRIPTFNHIRYLHRMGHEVHVASLMGSKDERQFIGKMGEWARSVHVEVHTRLYSSFGKVVALLTGKPLSLGHYFNASLNEKIRAAIAQHGIEAVVVFSSSMAQYVEEYSDLVRIMNFCDLDSQKWDDLSKLTFWPKSWIYRREARLLLAYERKLAAAFTGSCVVTENEAAAFRRLIPGSRVHVVANGVDHEFFGAVERKPVGLQLAFVGVMDYEPNIEAASYFVREVWPGIRARNPSARFNIVGARPTRAVQALASEAQGVVVTGSVPDVRPYLAEATLVVVPLGVARGIQNKVLEAMAAGVPVLTTTAAAAGFAPAARECLNICDREPGALITGVEALLADPVAAGLRAEKAKSYVRQNVSWQISGASLEGILLAAKPPAETARSPAREPAPAATKQSVPN